MRQLRHRRERARVVRAMTKAFQRGLGRYGFEIRRIDDVARVDVEGEFPPDFDDSTKELIRFVDGYTMTGPERLSALRTAVRHVVRHGIPGAIVECGVWKGGSMMAVAKTLLQLGDESRDLYLFDTFAGMPKPTPHDVDFAGGSAFERWNSTRRNRFTPRAAQASLAEVRGAMARVGYDAA